MMKKVLLAATALTIAAGTAHASNKSYIEQVGTSNSATVDSTASTGNSNSRVDQQGTLNSATVTIAGTNARSRVFQGCSVVDCAGDPNAPYNADHNTATVNMTASQSGSFSYVFQLDSYNSANVTLRSTGFITNPDNAATGTSLIQQQGTKSDSTHLQQAIVDVSGPMAVIQIFQGYSVDESMSPAGSPVVYGSLVDQPATSGRNYARSFVVSTATNARSDIYQADLANYADVRQETGNNQFSEIRQSGGTFGGAGGNNTAIVNQRADDTTSFILQAGVSNSATVSQNAAGAFSDVQQRGTANVAHVSQ